ncbi:MAG TPA: hypothetical protein VHD63_12835, partial [Ktedonobacteraceae bacterium]|nr:hypothetical protein [Ktedonobacteraceae bacterium]
MKFKDQIMLVGGGSGAITLVAILASVHEQLITVGPWVLDALLASLGSLVLYGGFRVYVAGRKHWLTIRAQELEVQSQRQQLRQNAEKHEWEIKALQADIHVRSSRIYADSNGNYPLILPTIVDMLPEHLQGQIMTFAPGQMKGLRSGQPRPELPEHAASRQGEEPALHAVPTRVRYEDIVQQIPAGHSCLGISEHGLETCDFRDLMTMLISGGSSTGKSNTVAIKLDEAMRIGRNTHMVVIDPHKNKPDSLYHKIRQYESRFLCPVAQKDEEIMQVLRWFKQEFDRRMELPTEELEELDDILLVVDEVFALCFHREDERIKKLIKLVSGIAGYESRGYGMYAWFL